MCSFVFSNKIYDVLYMHTSDEYYKVIYFQILQMASYAGIMLVLFCCTMSVAAEFPFPVGLNLDELRNKVSAAIRINSAVHVHVRPKIR